MKVNFKPFDLEAAKNGEPVMTRGGGTVEIISFDLNHEFRKIAAIITKPSGEQYADTYTLNGSKDVGDYKSPNTLVMVSFDKLVKKWVNLYREEGIVKLGKRIEKLGDVIYDTKEQAEMGQPNEQTSKRMEYVKAIQVEIWYKTTCAGE